jgi:Kef-type K+ transport system membrane component KefB
LKDLDVMDTRTSETIISAALITDLVLLFAMGIVISSGREATSISDVLVLAAGFAGFFVLAFLIGKYAVPYIYRLLKWMRTGEAAFAVAVGIAMGFAVIAQVMGLPSFIGAFIAGLILRETGKGLKVWVRVEDILSGVTLGFLAPIFFVLIGFSVKFDAVSNALPMLLAITSVAIVGKIVGSFIPARLLGHGENESMAIGSMMMGKGAMELVFAKLAFEENLIDDQLFSLLVLMAFVSTFLAPILFRRFFNQAAANGEIGPESVGEARPDTFPGT